MHLVQSMAYINETPWHGLGNPPRPKSNARSLGKTSRYELAHRRIRSALRLWQCWCIPNAVPDQKVLYHSDNRFVYLL